MAHDGYAVCDDDLNYLVCELIALMVNTESLKLSIHKECFMFLIFY